MLKAQMIEGSKPPEALPQASETKSSSASDSVVDAELEELRSKLKDV